MALFGKWRKIATEVQGDGDATELHLTRDCHGRIINADTGKEYTRFGVVRETEDEDNANA